MSDIGALGNFEEFLRPFLGPIVFTDCVHGSTRVRRDAADDYGSIHPLHLRSCCDRRTYMMSDGVRSGSQRKNQDVISNTQLEFRDSENDVCRTFRNASARLLTQSSNQTLNHKPRPGLGRGWNVREIRMKGWI